MRNAPIGNAPTVSLVLLLILAASFASAAERDRLPRSTRVSTVNLQPHPDAEIIIPSFRAIYLPNGSVALSVTGTGDLNTPIQGYDFEVDLASGTYLTRRISEAEMRRRLKSSGRSGEYPEPATKVYKAGSYRVRVLLQTKDPINIVLTETSAALEWDVSSTGTTIYRYGGDYCWANEYSSAGTTWYVDYCVHGDLWWSAGDLCNDIEGWYHNYDYGWDDQITTAHQYVTLCSRRDGTYGVSHFHGDSGEDAGFIRGSLYHYYY